VIILRKYALPLLAIVSCLLIVSCGGASSTIKHSYVIPEFEKMDLHGVLVVAVTKQNSSRIEFEDAFTSALARHKVTAKASHELLPQANPEAEEVIAAAIAADLDTILVTRYVGEMTEEVYHPGTVYYGVTPVYGAGRYNRFGGYYAHAYEVAYEQPVWTANKVHTVISDLYVAESREHLWQAVSDTVQAGSTSKLRDDAIKGLISNLKDQGLLR
jgi:hypothetical protein